MKKVEPFSVEDMVAARFWDEPEQLDLGEEYNRASEELRKRYEGLRAKLPEELRGELTSLDNAYLAIEDEASKAFYRIGLADAVNVITGMLKPVA